MAGRILQEDIETLRQRADIVDVVSDHTKLQRAGSRMKGLCPFHQERTPSFSVDPGQNLFHCFGCGVGGDVYTFMQQIEGLSFTEAVEQLARRTGFELRYEELSAGQKKALGERSRLVAANEAAAEFFHQQLYADAGTPAREYLKERGFGREEAEHFRLGYAPNEWESLTRHLQQERFTDRDLTQSGLAIEGDRGRLRDRFRGRLVFPVLDLNGDVIGFGGRVLPGLDYGDYEPPKYLNSPETPVYHKNRVLYGMSWARPEIVRTGEVFVGEGYTDVMALHQAGFTNAVATCGTAVGEEHFRLLERYAQRVILAFDSDEAGQSAAERAWELSRAHDVEVRVLVMPAGNDPADVVRDGGADAMRALVADAEPVIRFMLRRAGTPVDGTPEGRSAAMDAAAPLLAGIDDPVLRDQYTRWVADEVVGLSVQVVAQAVERRGADVEAAPASDPEAPRIVTGDRRELSVRAQLEREVLRVALQRHDLLPERWREVTDTDFVHPKARSVFTTLREAGGVGTPLADVLAGAEDDELRVLIREIALEEFTVEPDEPHVDMIVGRLLLHRIEKDIADRKSELERMNPTVDPDRYRARFEQLIELEARRRDLREVATG